MTPREIMAMTACNQVGDIWRDGKAYWRSGADEIIANLTDAGYVILPSAEVQAIRALKGEKP